MQEILQTIDIQFVVKFSVILLSVAVGTLVGWYIAQRKRYVPNAQAQVKNSISTDSQVKIVRPMDNTPIRPQEDRREIKQGSIGVVKKTRKPIKKIIVR